MFGSVVVKVYVGLDVCVHVCVCLYSYFFVCFLFLKFHNCFVF